MPGFITHYLFGINTYHTLRNKTLRQDLQQQHAAYSLGLQGPDIFFYFLPSYLIHGRNIGSVAHSESTGKFLRSLIESQRLFHQQEEIQIARAYIMGFLGHYFLDCQCHPYIYWRTNHRQCDPAYYGGHIHLETDIDAELLHFYRRKLPSALRKGHTIHLNRLQLRTIATILSDVYARTYPGRRISRLTMRLAIRSMQLGTRLLHDPSGRKKTAVRRLESLTTGRPLLSSLIASDTLRFYPDPLNESHHTWYNPWAQELHSDASFLQLMERAQLEYALLLPKLHELFRTEPHSQAAQRLKQELLTMLGNRSYHSGLSQHTRK